MMDKNSNGMMPQCKINLGKYGKKFR